ncbi:MAG TPA: hypothetical protein VFA80_13055 [Xanthobacteraceae bacterium]|jgi:hypothetical protein|nr:hypothetical protein [Xanthobacteraceae bacterium]
MAKPDRAMQTVTTDASIGLPALAARRRQTRETQDTWILRGLGRLLKLKLTHKRTEIITELPNEAHDQKWNNAKR